MKTTKQENCEHNYDILYRRDWMKLGSSVSIERCSNCEHERLNHKGIIISL